jgi:glycosyltransferase involved in cell wall biosynthesis
LVVGEFAICYIGALWGEWFDWDLLCKIALAYPKASVVVIGDYRGRCLQPLPNLHFLGLKAQVDLPAYLAYSDVAIIPWSISPLTHATNPLKVYEYLAMGKPVVAPTLKSLEGIPYVFASNSHDEFIANIEKARGIRIDEDVIESFIAHNSWAQRVSVLMNLARQSTGKRISGGNG